MNKYIEHAISDYENAVATLAKFCAENTDFEVTITTDSYPIRFTLSPRDDAMQESMFETDSNGAVGDIEIIYCSGGVSAEFGLKCHLESNTVKKLFNLCAAVGDAYLHSYKAQEELCNE